MGLASGPRSDFTAVRAPSASQSLNRRPFLPLALAASVMLGLGSGSDTASAQTVAPAPRPMPTAGWQFGAVLDTAYMSQGLPLGLRDKGLGLGHSDLLARGSLGRHLAGEAIVVGATHEGHLEHKVEKFFVQTRTLPAGLQARAGRFASQVGYLNEQHPHADDFVERPAMYRAFLGHHYFDDGVRLNWTAPTPFYLQLGLEALSGRQLSPEGERRSRSGVTTFSSKFGSDIGTNQAWQAGASVLINRRASATAHDEHGDEHGHTVHHDDHGDGHGAGHAHGHGAAFAGRRLAMFDLAWKWAPNGNPRQQQLRVVLEHARLSGLQDAALIGRRHEGSSLSVVWRFRPDFEAGVRADRLRAAYAHDDHFDQARLNEQAMMLAYKPSHRQTLRLQWTTNRDVQGFDPVGRRLVSLQYVVAFGAHGAHSF